ncbi:hypothetical protein FA09DRAFT_327967 [Tilletiopsis washingtonensis]|jgi:subtilisin family serine protease|uniref:Uncharacterized protein n=1 Tax=Tilletiopsis washingtonensis TaxID=58919 RepID=A0A316ZFN1_9BASI|nr:hypothetical protein FA09DRAFT_327967 [Tilletiopsis washingtonensis]PWO00551.1 hypothetical protein FA09DRAFT_327967 [Tilletiopsis washingtonensis]
MLPVAMSSGMRALACDSAAVLRATRARGFASSASTSAPAAAAAAATPSSSRPAPSRAGKRRARAARDDKLRHAIELFHRAPTFYASPASTPGAGVQSEETPEAKRALDQRVMEDVLYPYTDYIEGAEDQTFLTLAAVASNAARDAASLNSATSTVQAPSKLVSGYNPEGTPVPPESASLTAMPSAESEATRSYLEQLIKEEDSRRAVVNVGYTTPSSVSRAVLVRDALFGTVHGEKPGLEVVRERAAARKARMEQDGTPQGP